MGPNSLMVVFVDPLGYYGTQYRLDYILFWGYSISYKEYNLTGFNITTKSTTQVAKAEFGSPTYSADLLVV